MKSSATPPTQKPDHASRRELRPHRRIVRLVAANLGLTLASLSVVAGVAETYLRWTTPFMDNVAPRAFVPGVGLLYEPNAEVRVTNGLDFWAVAQTNSLGFLDREPLSPQRATETCHVSVLGDSFVAAEQVPIPSKFHVLLERLADRKAPALHITTSAFGCNNTAQANQLLFYDEYARRLDPRILVLVFVDNDFGGNSALTMALRKGWDPDLAPFAYPRRTIDGTLELRVPSAEYRQVDLRSKSWLRRTCLWNANTLFVGSWLCYKTRSLLTRDQPTSLVWREELRRRPRYEPRLSASSALGDLADSKEATADSAFALRQFKERAERDNVALLILSEYRMGGTGHRHFDRMSAMAEPLNIPIISLYDYVTGLGKTIKDTHWEHDGHWNLAGHQWAAEALLQYIQEHPKVCAR